MHQSFVTRTQSLSRAGHRRANVVCFYFCTFLIVRFYIPRQTWQCNVIADCGGKLPWFPHSVGNCSQRIKAPVVPQICGSGEAVVTKDKCIMTTHCGDSRLLKSWQLQPQSVMFNTALAIFAFAYLCEKLKSDSHRKDILLVNRVGKLFSAG